MKTRTILHSFFITIILVASVIQSCAPNPQNSPAGNGGDDNDPLERVLKIYNTSNDRDRIRIENKMTELYIFRLNPSILPPHRGGKGISSVDAENFTKEYYNKFNSNELDTISKSVYFELAGIYKFIQGLKKLPTYDSTKTLGLRLYMATYPVTPHNDALHLSNKNTVILRGVQDYEDIPHQADEFDILGNLVKIVAFDFGDVCPPVCEKNQAPGKFCKGGMYNILGKPDCN